MDHTRHVHKWLLYTKQKYYEFGRKSSRLLAHQLKNQNNDRSINMIRTQKEDVSCNPLIVNSTFQDFYKSLYSAEQADAVSIASYLNNIPLPTIAEEDCSSLNAAFTLWEVWAAIQSMPNGKCPGPDWNWIFLRSFGQRFNQFLIVHRAFNVVHYLNTYKNPALMVSLDSKKAFDWVERSFLFLVLEKFGLGPSL